MGNNVKKWFLYQIMHILDISTRIILVKILEIEICLAQIFKHFWTPRVQNVLNPNPDFPYPVGAESSEMMPPPGEPEVSLNVFLVYGLR